MEHKKITNLPPKACMVIQMLLHSIYIMIFIVLFFKFSCKKGHQIRLKLSIKQLGCLARRLPILRTRNKSIIIGLGKPQKSSVFSGPTTKALPPSRA